MYDKYNQENSDLDSLPEPARVLLSEKEQLVNALQVGSTTRGGYGVQQGQKETCALLTLDGP